MLLKNRIPKKSKLFPDIIFPVKLPIANITAYKILIKINATLV